MKAQVFIALWLGAPFLGFLYEWLVCHRLRKQGRHERILYAFKAVRDRAAIKALRGELSKNSQAYDLFYRANSWIIDNHRFCGVCFKHLAQGVADEIGTPSRTKTSSELAQQIRQGDAEMKSIAKDYAHAIVMMIVENSGSLLLKALLRTLAKASRMAADEFLYRLPSTLSCLLLPRAERKALELSHEIALASATGSARIVAVPLVHV